jgi:hypothetical protein
MYIIVPGTLALKLKDHSALKNEKEKNHSIGLGTGPLGCW